MVTPSDEWAGQEWVVNVPQELHQRQANDVDPTLRFIDGRSFQPLAAELPYHQEEGPKGTVKLSNLHHRTGLRATTDEGEVTSLASARKTAPDTTIPASQLRSAPRPEIPRASSPQQRSLGSYFTNFGVETGEFRRAVSVRKFPISVFAAPSNPENSFVIDRDQFDNEVCSAVT